MFVNRVVLDNWIGIINERDEIDEPEFANLQRWIDELNATTRTMMSMYGQGGIHVHMAVGGGAGQYVVYAQMNHGDYWNLLSGHGAEEAVIMLNAGGQVGDFPSRQVVDKATALKAVQTFFRNGQLDNELLWEKQK